MDTDRINRVRAVCIYCASGTGVHPAYGEAAEKTGSLLGKRGIRVINGAGSTGLMRTVSEAVLREGGSVTGVIPRFMVRNGWCDKSLTEIIEVETMHERKQRMAALSDAVIALPGGCGTLEELLEIITWKQLGLYRHPVVILNTNRYYDPLFTLFRQAADERFLLCRESLWHESRTPEDAVETIFNACGQATGGFRHTHP
ncbi:MAG: TIGR00730 family Rossman fold protein [Tannerella sp.]|jgi:uncharacterized protein (TIGR00730 family)|nr:TIGR00730 family Rossman fold protein [Tannerella sp.]